MSMKVQRIFVSIILCFWYIFVFWIITIIVEKEVFSNFFIDESIKFKPQIILKGFTATAYCPEECCNGKWAHMTATGKPISYFTKRGINIIAVDPKVIPLYTKVIYNNKEYLAVDVGGKIKGKRIDVFFPKHEQTIIFGVKRNVDIQIIP